MSEKDLDTAGKIKEAASKLFTERGFGRTTTRDIAKSAGVNLALVSYYFGGKDALFKTIMLEAVDGFAHQLKALMNNDNSFEEKVSALVNNYIDFLQSKPELPVFMLSEIRTQPEELIERLGMKKLMQEATFFQELAQRCPEGIFPVHLFVNLLSMCVFPFIAKPMVSIGTGMDDQAFMMMMEQRRTLIPQWFLSMLKPQE